MKIILFTAIWCPSCLIMRPRYKELIKNDSQTTLEEVDFDDHPDLVKQFKIGNILPVAIVFNNQKKEIKRIVGEVSSKKLAVMWLEL